MSVGKRVIEDFAELKSLRAIPRLLDPPAGVGKNTNIDAVLIHDIKILAVIERVEAHASDVILRFRHELEKFPWKRVKMSVDDHDLSFTTRLVFMTGFALISTVI
jgi:hypothetical protein